MFVVFLPIVLVAAAAIAWVWWSNTRPQRVPVTSVESFQRALDAMRPDDPPRLVTRPSGSRSRV